MRDTFFPSGKRFPTEKHQISPLHISKIGSNLDAFSYISLLRCIPGNNNIMLYAVSIILSTSCFREALHFVSGCEIDLEIYACRPSG